MFLLPHIILNSILFGVILMTQIVSYPMFLNVDNKSFSSYHMHYTFNISKIVLPLMILEVFFVIEMLVNKFDILGFISLILVLLIWISTILIQGPYHNVISKEFNEKIIGRLINSNWIRTTLWLAKLLALVFLGDFS